MNNYIPYTKQTLTDYMNHNKGPFVCKSKTSGICLEIDYTTNTHVYFKMNVGVFRKTYSELYIYDIWNHDNTPCGTLHN